MWERLLDNAVFMLALLPLVGAGLVLASARLGIEVVRRSALTNLALSGLLAALMIGHYDPQRQTADGNVQTVQMESQLRWLAERGLDPTTGRTVLRGPDVRLAVGVDGVSLWLVALVVLFTFSAALAGWDVDRKRPDLFYALLLGWEATLIGMFAAQDVVLLCICLELSLLLSAALIGGWGGSERQPVVKKFLHFQLAGSACVLFGLMALLMAHSWMWWLAGETETAPRVTFQIAALIDGTNEIPSVPELAEFDVAAARYWSAMQPWISGALILGFIMLAGVVPFHTWLPGVLTDGPTAVGLLVVGGNLPMGLYGLLRFVVPLFPDVSHVAGWPVMLAVCGAVYAGLLTLAQGDLRTLAAAAVTTHVGVCAAGIFSGSPAGLTGAVVLMLSLGLTAGIFLLLVGALHRRYETSELQAYGGLAARFPRFGGAMSLAGLGWLAAPGLSGFIGLLLIVLGLTAGDGTSPNAGRPLAAFWALFASLLLSWAVLRGLERILRGPFREPVFNPDLVGSAAVGRCASPAAPVDAADQRGDLRFRECLAVIPLAAATIAVGIHPQFVVRRVEPTVVQMLEGSAMSNDEGETNRVQQFNPHLCRGGVNFLSQ